MIGLARLRPLALVRRFLALGFGAVLTTASAHPTHVSLAEADYNRDTQRLEIAVTVFADDLLLALRRPTAAPASFTTTPAAELDALIRAYLGANFHVRANDGSAQTLHWVGRELDQDDGEQRLWLYFESPLPGGPDGVRLHHGLLHDTIPQQRNTVAVRDGARRTTLVFTRGDSAKMVRFSE
ncbi:MAG: hypothetical protein Q8J74_14120 [Candidatus Didemnitutus sp.]|nr:hypothetical protein [Candidatus Didemnitutus sp.]